MGRRFIGIKKVFAVAILFVISGCASPGVQFTRSDNTIEITPVKGSFEIPVISSLLGGGLKAGKYACQFDEHVKASFDSKQDLKLLDLNLSKLEN